MELDRRKEAPPLYIQVAREMASKIEKGEYAAGELIPCERELQAMYNVSRMTVRLAMSDLVNRGYIEGRRGIGTMVIYGKIKESIKQVRSITEEMAQQGVEMKTTDCVLEKEKLPSIVALTLGKKPMEECLVLKRVRMARGRPLVYSLCPAAKPDAHHHRPWGRCAGSNLKHGQSIRKTEASGWISCIQAYPGDL